MRRDQKGDIHTLDQDIFDLWKAHGWEVEKIVVPGSGGKVSVPGGAQKWIVEAKTKS